MRWTADQLPLRHCCSTADARTCGGRLLTSAAKQGDVGLVRLLLDHGAEGADAENLGPLGTDRTIGELLVGAGSI